MALRFQDIALGDTAPPRRAALGRTDFVRYAGASGDFNPMHHDEIKATAAGMPSVFGHGMLSAGILASAVTEWVGIGALTHYAVRFTKQAWPDVTLEALIEVTGKDEQALTVDLACSLVDASGTVVVQGTATARLAA